MHSRTIKVKQIKEFKGHTPKHACVCIGSSRSKRIIKGWNTYTQSFSAHIHQLSVRIELTGSQLKTKLSNENWVQGSNTELAIKLTYSQGTTCSAVLYYGRYFCLLASNTAAVRSSSMQSVSIQNACQCQIDVAPVYISHPINHFS